MERVFFVTRLQRRPHAFPINISTHPSSRRTGENRPQRALPLWKWKEIQEVFRRTIQSKLQNNG